MRAADFAGAVCGDHPARGARVNMQPVDARRGVRLAVAGHVNVGPVAGEATAESLLAAVARDRDRAAFAQLFRLYGPRIKGYLGKRGADLATADELVQEVMLAVWRKAHQFDGARGNASTWIFTISRNTLFSHLRHVARPEVDPADPARVPAEALPDEQLAALRDQAAVAAAMESLPPEQVEAIRGAYFQGQTLNEVAERQKVPLGTVKTRVRLALERLRRLVGPGDVP
jgi:RNA polymerase sigma factor (sigma-70 family)